MGYVVLHIEKAAGTDAAMSGHVERRIAPANVITTLTYLNEELIEFPKGVTNRTEAIQHRLDNAGLERKIGKNQVRALRVMLSGSPEDMKRIRQAGQLDAWAKDSCGWLQKTFGKENVVSALLHLDEKTPHIHATVVPITRGERRKAKLEREKNAQSGKRTYRTKKDRPRLCADDVMARDKLKAYQTTYAEAMAKYGLRRGVEGSEAKHISTQQYYREVFVRKNEIAEQVENLKEQRQTLTVDIAALQAQQRAAQTDCNTIDEQRRKKKDELAKAETELAQTRREIKTDKLKGVAVDATTKAVERIGALFHDPKPARYEKQIADLRDVIEGKDKDIKSLQREIATIQAGHDKEKDEIKQRMYEAVKALMRVDELCPYVKGLLKWENYCKNAGLDKEGTRALFTMQPYRYTGELHSIRYNHTFWANDIVLQLKPDKDGPGGFRFTINGKDDDVWFKQQRKEFYEKIGIDIERTEQRRGIKI
ncbi:MobV family relaxase [uncultured Alistipes sp.]|uniref:MobV family relaxase n=1 Tax=uncultured Alistipes sp. TaxID=538949 RepID=UPI00258D0B43|nr:MobV family relaxase [uncultured Alistipes sp.]